MRLGHKLSPARAKDQKISFRQPLLAMARPYGLELTTPGSDTPGSNFHTEANGLARPHLGPLGAEIRCMHVGTTITLRAAAWRLVLRGTS